MGLTTDGKTKDETQKSGKRTSGRWFKPPEVFLDWSRRNMAGIDDDVCAQAPDSAEP